MRTCSKCGSYVPEGKLFCISCNRPVIGVSQSARQSTLYERKQTHARIEEAFEQTELKGFFRRDNKNPYHGDTYEQHRSHDPRSKDYYKSKYQRNKELAESGEGVISLFAYMGFFFFLPLVLLPDSKFARFHANQGLVLFLFDIVLGIIVGLDSAMFYGDMYILSVLPPLLMMYGIFNAVTGQMRELPIIGKLQILKEKDTFFGGNRWGR